MVEELDAMGMMDNTLLALASDNGACATYGGSNYPFRGFKTTLFEGGVRTPALVYSKSESIIPLKVLQLATRYYFPIAPKICVPTKVNDCHTLPYLYQAVSSCIGFRRI